MLKLLLLPSLRTRRHKGDGCGIMDAVGCGFLLHCRIYKLDGLLKVMIVVPSSLSLSFVHVANHSELY